MKKLVLLATLAMFLFQPMPASAAMVPYTGTAKPDFSKSVQIHVPDGWTHRNGEGTLHLEDGKDPDAWMEVEVFRLQGTAPRVMATNMKGKDAELEVYEGNENSFMWSAYPPWGGDKWNHFYTASPEHDIWVHLIWPPKVQMQLVKSVISGSLLHGKPLSGPSAAVATATGEKQESPKESIH